MGYLHTTSFQKFLPGDEVVFPENTPADAVKLDITPTDENDEVVITLELTACYHPGTTISKRLHFLYSTTSFIHSYLHLIDIEQKLKFILVFVDEHIIETQSLFSMVYF